MLLLRTGFVASTGGAGGGGEASRSEGSGGGHDGAGSGDPVAERDGVDGVVFQLGEGGEQARWPGAEGIRGESVEQAEGCRLPKPDRGTGRAVGIERRWSAMSLVLALLGAARAALRTHTNLALENLALRQQLALLRHLSKRPRFGRLDRAFW